MHYGPVALVLDVPDGAVLLAWAANPHKQQVASVVFFATAGGQPVETLRLPGAYCVRYAEQFVRGDVSGGSYQCALTLSDPTGWTIAAGGLAAAFVAPAAGSHGIGGGAVAAVVNAVGICGAMAPAAAAAASAVGIGGAATPVSVPFVAPTATSPRLPLIIGDPPFHCKGAEKGKKGKNGAPDKPDKEALDPVEFERQLTGQQEGMNKLSVAAFIANRDQYIKTSKDNKGKNNKNGGRDIKEGNPAQKLARQEAFKAKSRELRIQNPALTQEQAEIDTSTWLENQTALHDPDQVAGGYATNITGMGDERINSSIGGAWPWRIKKIDKQIRDYAKKMTPEEQQTTYLNISLPFTKPVV